MKSKVAKIIMLLFVSSCLQGALAQVEINVDEICKAKTPLEKFNLLKKIEFRELSIQEKDKVWQNVLHFNVSTNSEKWLSFFSDMPILMRYLIWKDDSATNDFRLTGVADHIGRFEAMDVSFFDREVKQAFEADERLIFPDGKYRRRTGTHGHAGPNMLALKRRLSRANCWNGFVVKYRKDILSAVRRALEKSKPASAEVTKDFLKEFSKRAKLTKEEEKLVLTDL